MNYLQRHTGLCLLIVLVLYAVVGTMEYQDQLKIEEYRRSNEIHNT